MNTSGTVSGAKTEPVDDGEAAADAAPNLDAHTQPVENENLDRFLTGLVTVLPIIAVGIAAWQLWDSALRWSDVIVFGVLYIATALGITIGFHRMLTHRSFKTVRPLRWLFAALGSCAIEGPVISWVSDHRRHHAFSDQDGDPHSPHVGHGHGVKGVLKGLFHAHLGWLFIHVARGSRERYAPDLMADRGIRMIDATFFLWVAVGLAVPFGLGVAIGGDIGAGLTALLWGGAVRVFLLHHVTYSINSLCHFFGRKDYETGDESRNLAWLAPISMGEAWHNNHHAFPTSAAHGLRWWQFDISGIVIRALERVGLVWDVVKIDDKRKQSRAIGAAKG